MASTLPEQRSIIPSNLVSHHGVQHRNKLTHAGCQRYLFVFSLVDELAVKRMVIGLHCVALSVATLIKGT